MTNPQVTQADQERAAELQRPCLNCQGYGGVSSGCFSSHDCPDCLGSGKVAPSIDDIALELAKVRQQAYAKMQAACLSEVVELLQEVKRGKSSAIERVRLGGVEEERMRQLHCALNWLQSAEAIIQDLTLDGTNALEEDDGTNQKV